MNKPTTVVCATLALLALPVGAQQLITGATGAECAARGGSIRTWTSSMDVNPPRGECYVPPRASGGGGGGTGNRARSAETAGAVGNFAGAVGNFIDTMNQIEADRQARNQQWENDLRAERDQWRQATVNREGALLQQEAELRAREKQQQEQQQQQAAAAAMQTGANPFASAAPSASANPFAAPANAPGAALKSDQQIKAECARSGNPGVCEATAFAARAFDPGYRQWKAAENARLDANVKRSKAEVDRLMAERARGKQAAGGNDPDLEKCREGATAPQTIAGCYDLQAGGPGAKPEQRESVRDQLRRALAGGDDQGTGSGASPASPQVAIAPAAAVPAPTASSPPVPSGPWATGPWRTNDERACREAGGMLGKPNGENDLAGIPQAVLDNPSIPRAQLAATSYCFKVGDFRMAGSETDAEVKRMLEEKKKADAPK